MTLQEAIEGVENMIKDAEEILNEYPDHMMLSSPMKQRIKLLQEIKLTLLKEDRGVT